MEWRWGWARLRRPLSHLFCARSRERYLDEEGATGWTAGKGKYEPERAWKEATSTGIGRRWDGVGIRMGSDEVGSTRGNRPLSVF